MAFESIDWRLLATVFVTVFLAELGDKTQLATLVFSARSEEQRWIVFVAAAGALVVAAAIGVLLGGVVAKFVSEKALNMVAGIAFIALGLWTLWRA